MGSGSAVSHSGGVLLLSLCLDVRNAWLVFLAERRYTHFRFVFWGESGYCIISSMDASQLTVSDTLLNDFARCTLIKEFSRYLTSTVARPMMNSSQTRNGTTKNHYTIVPAPLGIEPNMIE